MRKAIVETATGFVRNIVEWDPGANWECPAGCELMDGDGVGQGWSWDGEQFIKPESTPRSQIDVLMDSPGFTMDANEGQVPKSPAVMIAEGVELLGLLHAKLKTDPDGLTAKETQRMLQLERQPV
tara:strand:- start:70 stop:444 length:375 start_codon:yes stop_codon:yes gene_type:complete